MKLSLDKILQNCPRKLLALYPQIIERIQLYEDTPEYLWNDLEPLIILIPGSRGCIDGDSLLETQDGLVRVKDWTGGFIKTWDGKQFIYAYAGKSVEYQPKELYEVRLENGDCFVATNNHYALTPYGFFPVASLKDKQVATFHDQPVTSLDNDLSMLPINAQRLIGIILNSLYYYFLDYHHGDEPLHLGVNTYLDIVPSLSDVQRFGDYVLLHMDDLLVLLRRYVRLYQHVSHLSTLAVHHEYEEQRLPKVDTYIASRLSELLDVFSQVCPQSLALCNRDDKVYLFLELLQTLLNEINQDESLLNILVGKSLAFDDNSFSNSINTNNLTFSKVKSITFIGKRKYYDLFVPYYHNYIANGIIHHNSGKSEFAQRAMIAGIYEGTINAVKYATMTENGINGSKDAFERLAPECRGTGANTSKANPMHRFIQSARVDFDFFGKQDIKNEQRKYDVLICEEVEKWDKVQGVAALETEIRHCKVIILISNNPPQSVVDFCKAHDAQVVRCDWWENLALPSHIRESYERAKTESPVYYTRFIMCQNDVDAAQWFDNTGVENFFSRKYTDLSEEEKETHNSVLSIDVGGGYGDESVVAKVYKNVFGAILVEVCGKYQLESPQLVVRVAGLRASTGTISEVWDCDGIGLSTFQQRAPDPKTRMALNITAFHGAGTASDPSVFNQRSQAYYTWQKLVNQNQCWYVGNPSYIEQLKREMFAQIYATAEQSKGLLRLADKKEIKKNLNGESPNIADAIAMGIWYVTTHNVKNVQVPFAEYERHGISKPMKKQHWF